MEVLHRLATVLTAVGDDAVAVRKSLGGSDCGNDLEDAGHKGAVVGSDAVGGGYVGLGDDEDVSRSHGGDVAEGVDLVVLVYLG